jgi:uncharacterized protein YbjT (DUF2867 family)
MQLGRLPLCQLSYSRPAGITVLDTFAVRIVVIGGTRLIGSKLVARLVEQGHEAVAAAPSRGVDTITGEGLAEALEGASVVIDVSQTPSFEYAIAARFFETSTRHLLAAEEAASVEHHVTLSVVGSERLPESGYFRAKMAQESVIRASPIPFSIVHATQFFEFMTNIAQDATDGDTVRLPAARFQPVAADDVAKAVARVAVGPPMDRVVEVAGPESFPLDGFIRAFLAARRDPRHVLTDPRASYFGALLGERTLLPGAGAILGKTRFDDWLRRSA